MNAKIQMQRLQANYPFLFPLGIEKEQLHSLWVGLDCKELNYERPTFYIDSKDQLKPVILHHILKRGKFIPTVFMNGYRLLDIYLGNDEEYEALSHIKTPRLVIYLGYGEFENKRQVDAIQQVFERLFVKGSEIILYYKGTIQTFEVKFPGLRQYLESRNFVQTTVGVGSVVPSHIEEEL